MDLLHSIPTSMTVLACPCTLTLTSLLTPGPMTSTMLLPADIIVSTAPRSAYSPPRSDGPEQQPFPTKALRVFGNVAEALAFPASLERHSNKTSPMWPTVYSKRQERANGTIWQTLHSLGAYISNHRKSTVVNLDKPHACGSAHGSRKIETPPVQRD